MGILRIGPALGIFEMAGGDGDIARVGGDAFAGLADGGLEVSERAYTWGWNWSINLLVGYVGVLKNRGGHSLARLGCGDEELRGRGASQKP